jgi:putative DNA primase/helicase
MPRTNQEFLERVFGPDWDHALVCVKDIVRKGDGWPCGFAKDMLRHATDKTNNYFALSLFQGTHRKASEWLALFALLIDDVGTKVLEPEVERVLGPPSWIVRTSVSAKGEENHQWGYRLAVPVSDQGRAWSLCARVQLALPGADNMDATHPVRLPYGRHRKEENEARQPGGWAVKLVRWSDRVIEEAWLHARLNDLGVSQARMPAHLGGQAGQGGGSVDEDKDPLWRALDELGLVLGERRGATSLGPGRTWNVRCPWAGEHTERVNEGAAYGVGGGFRCMHGHCSGKTMDDFKARLNELLLEQSGGAKGLASVFFDEMDDTALAQLAAGGANNKQGKAEVLVAIEFAGREKTALRFNASTGRWCVWDQDRWRPDQTGAVVPWRVQQLILTQFRRVRALLKGSAVWAIERLARTNQDLVVGQQDWDRDQWRIGVPGGEVDLRTGVLGPADPAHMITRQTLVAPAPSGTPIPVWDRFLAEAMGGDQDMVAFVHHWFGYCLSGDTSWEVFAFLWGTGGNGKGVLVGAMNAIFGDYVVRAPTETFMERRNPEHPTEIARLAGARLVLASEVSDKARFNLARLKEHTGNEGSLTGRFMNRDFFEFVPSHKLTFVGNHKPRLAHVDEAIKRRTLLWPFTFRPAQPDLTLKARLVAEYPGILRKLIDAGVEVHLALDLGGTAAMSKMVPPAVLAATAEYFEENDAVAQWLTARCEIEASQQVLVSDAYQDHTTWCCNVGLDFFPWPRKFSGMLKDRHVSLSVVHTMNGSVIKGLGLKFGV